ncbi:MAG: 2-oxoglutarate dehydrogenase complex dihydrolipoyllysine-residue succinyltransferase [Pseudomonadales bacterium]|nr:2-oxoglutarate dehydrogenase complex dihydrolipoyllysine-residue succinyltransferase [Pseudomonadales bacterium]
MDIKTPAFPESITEGTVAQWYKAPGEFARRDDVLVDIETDKVVMEVLALDDGTLTEILKNEGDIVESEELLGRFEVGPATSVSNSTDPAGTSSSTPEEVDGASPAARKLATESGVAIDSIVGSGRDGRVTKEDVAKAVAQGSAQRIGDNEPVRTPVKDETWQSDASPLDVSGERIERRVPMTRLRASIARRLVEAQHNAAMLTTFNEVDMAPIMALRKQYQDDFQKAHNGTRLGYMSFFVRAATEALKRFPSVNASIDGEDIVYHGYYDIGVAVSTDRGLVVPVVREADALGMAQIEDQINAYGEKARSGKLALEDMAGGTFTISNGGIFGSLMSTPILNAPQTGVLGMHKIQERPVVVDGEIVIRPMMNLALSYDHRLIDGREAVQFLVAIKGMIEDPARILLEL